MKMKGRKVTAFITNLVVLVGLYLFTAYSAGEQLVAVGPTIIYAIIGNSAVFVGGVVMDKWQMSKFYRGELNENKS